MSLVLLCFRMFIDCVVCLRAFVHACVYVNVCTRGWMHPPVHWYNNISAIFPGGNSFSNYIDMSEVFVHKVL